MHVSLFGVVLFLHISVAIIAFAMAGVMHTSLQVVGRAREVQTVRSWGVVMHRIEPLFPIMALLLLGLGAWLVHLAENTDDHFRYTDGWVLTGIITLVAVEAAGGAILAPRGKKLTQLIHDAPDGAVSEDINRAANDPAVWHAAHITTFAFLGVVFLMAAKPDGAYAWLFPVIGAVVGVALAQLQLNGIKAAASSATVPGQRQSAKSAAKPRAKSPVS